MSEQSRPPETHASGSYQIASDEAAASREQRRLDALGRLRDPRTQALLQRVGLAPGWRCLEVGAGAGALPRWLAEQVGRTGEVLSTDIDLRFHDEPGEWQGVLEVREHDITQDSLPSAYFDLTHARAVMQHLPERGLALDRMVEATKPGGWIVLEDSDVLSMLDQPLPEPFGRVSRAVLARMQERGGWNGRMGSELLRMLDDRGLVELDLVGFCWTMCGGQDSAEWWVIALEYAAPSLVPLGTVAPGEVEEAVAQARQPGFRVRSPFSLQAIGRRPA